MKYLTYQCKMLSMTRHICFLGMERYRFNNCLLWKNGDDILFYSLLKLCSIVLYTAWPLGWRYYCFSLLLVSNIVTCAYFFIKWQNEFFSSCPIHITEFLLCSSCWFVCTIRTNRKSHVFFLAYDMWTYCC